MGDFINEAAVENDLADLTTLRAFERITDALRPISDDGEIDRGLGLGSCDLWLKMAGKEWYITIKPSNQPTPEHPDNGVP